MTEPNKPPFSWDQLEPDETLDLDEQRPHRVGTRHVSFQRFAHRVALIMVYLVSVYYTARLPQVHDTMVPNVGVQDLLVLFNTGFVSGHVMDSYMVMLNRVVAANTVRPIVVSISGSSGGNIVDYICESICV